MSAARVSGAVTGLRLRAAREDELPLLALIVAELDGGAQPSPDALRATWAAMQRYPDYVCYLAEIDGAVVGTLSMIVFPILSVRPASEAIVETVVIRPAFRGQGLGRAMIAEAMRLAAEKGAYKLALSSNLRRSDAHHFYEDMGFARHGYSFAIDTGAPGEAAA
ncbi:GNAT family N-acetyltransferase [Niveibacterium sp. SC-1]|uniref:GNAT family N-acetyltransferase n=1 Tax=Niveibacterium sp. SC-1 TaxID=3135646 RepID=UPI00311F043F